MYRTCEKNYHHIWASQFFIIKFILFFLFFLSFTGINYGIVFVFWAMHKYLPLKKKKNNQHIIYIHIQMDLHLYNQNLIIVTKLEKGGNKTKCNETFFVWLSSFFFILTENRQLSMNNRSAETVSWEVSSELNVVSLGKRKFSEIQWSVAKFTANIINFQYFVKKKSFRV